MKGIGARLAGDTEHFTFEQRIFNFTMLLTIVMAAFGTAMNFYYGISINILFDTLFLGYWILTYYFSRYRGYFDMVSVIAAGVFVFAYFPFVWITSGGIGSVIPHYAIVMLAFICIILAGKYRIVMVVSMLLMELCLVGRDLYSLSYGAGVDKFIALFLDVPIHLLVIMPAMAVLIIVYSNTYMKEKARSEEYARTIAEQYRQQLYYMENLEQVIYKLKSERHDFNNHLGVIYGLLENDEPDQATSYAAKLVKTAEEYQNIVNVPYSMIRVMLNYKLSAARDDAIELRLGIRLPADLMLNEFDLTVILGNLLDNAIEACAALEEDRRYIDLSIDYQPDYLIIQVENPVNKEAILPGRRSRTSKPDAENHGFGLSNIEYLVNKHHGLMKIELENGIFKVHIALLVNLHSQ